MAEPPAAGRDGGAAAVTTYTCPTCGSDVNVTDIKPDIHPVKNGFHARDLLRGLAAFGSSPELAVVNLRGGVSAYERALARYHQSASTGKATGA